MGRPGNDGNLRPTRHYAGAPGVGLRQTSVPQLPLLSAILADCHADAEAFSPWRLRHEVLQSDHAWRILAADVRGDLDTHLGARSLDVLDIWDRALEKGLHTARFFEVWLNACDANGLALSVMSRAAALKGFDLPWWDHAQHRDARNDLRDAFARLAPVAPVAGDVLLVRNGERRKLRTTNPLKRT